MTRGPFVASASVSCSMNSSAVVARLAGTPQPVAYEDPAYESFFADYRQGRYEVADRSRTGR